MDQQAILPSCYSGKLSINAEISTCSALANLATVPTSTFSCGLGVTSETSMSCSKLIIFCAATCLTLRRNELLLLIRGEQLASLRQECLTLSFLHLSQCLIIEHDQEVHCC